MERVVNKSEADYAKFELIAKELERLSPNGKRYCVRDVYLDLGQGWMWTTICDDECQILSPRQWREIMFASTLYELAHIVDDIRSDKYFRDK